MKKEYKKGYKITIINKIKVAKAKQIMEVIIKNYFLLTFPLLQTI